MHMLNIRYGGFRCASGVVNGVGYIYDKDALNEAICTGRRLNAYVMVYLLEGAGVYRDAISGEHVVKAGDVILLFPGVTHAYHRVDQTTVWSECFIEFHGRTFEALERSSIIRRDTPVLSPALQPTLVAEFDGIIRDYQDAGPGDEALLAARALLLLVRVAEAHKKKRQSESARSFVVDACARLQASLDQTIDVPQLAHSFGLSDRSFRRQFSEQMGVAPARYRMLQRIAAARILLVETTVPVGVIAERLGYCDVHFFSKQFKLVTGTTPARFRQAPAKHAELAPRRAQVSHSK